MISLGWRTRFSEIWCYFAGKRDVNCFGTKIALKVNNLLGHAQHRKWKTDFTAKLDQTFY